jgi:hypothetical protein
MWIIMERVTVFVLLGGLKKIWHINSCTAWDVKLISVRYMKCVMIHGDTGLIEKYLYNKDQQDEIFTFSFIPINNHYMFRACLLLIIRRYYSVYAAVSMSC